MEALEEARDFVLRLVHGGAMQDSMMIADVFGSALNAHLHFHCVVINGVFVPTPVGGVVFHLATAVDGPALATVQAKVRRRLFESFVRRGLLAEDDAQAMAQWAHGGGFSVDGSLRIEAADRAGRERL